MFPILRGRIGGRIEMMRLRAAFALCVALSVPAWAQHPGGQSGGGGGRAGGGGYTGGSFHAGGGGARGGYGGGHGGYPVRSGAPSYSGLVGLQAPSSFSQPGRFLMPGRLEPPQRAGVPLPYRGNGFYGGYRTGDRGRNPHRGPYRGHDHDHDRRHRGYYGYAPGYVYPYPYVVDPGFYDWGATDYSENEQGSDADVPPEQGANGEYGPEPPYPPNSEATYPQQESMQPPASAPIGPQRQEYHFASASPSGAATPITSKPLTVIFKGGRAPEKMQNYMVTASVLTDLDGEHFEKIPLDQVDVAATQQANRASGIDFQVPAASHD